MEFKLEDMLELRWCDKGDEIEIDGKSGKMIENEVEIDSGSRWTNSGHMMFELGDRIFGAPYQEGATESQDLMDEDIFYDYNYSTKTVKVSEYEVKEVEIPARIEKKYILIKENV